MYNNSPRMGLPPKPQTTDLVGPGTYDIGTIYPDKENYAPFLSQTPRENTFIKKPATEAIYNVADANEKHIRGGSSLRNKGKRFVSRRDDDIPGPGDYNPIVKKLERTAGPGRLYVCRVPFTRGESSPSVPTHIDENGYEIQGHDIIKIPANTYDTTRGPAYYHPKYEDPYKKRYGGCKWSKSNSQRTTFKIDPSGPSAAEYTVKAPKCVRNDYDEKYREMARLFTHLPRYTEQHELNAIRQGLPGPATYNIEPEKDTRRKKSIKPRPFIIGQNRFKSELPQDTPGPGDYEACEHVFKQHKSSVKQVPFGRMSPRSKEKIVVTPGPSDYVMKSPLVEKLLCKENPYSSVHVPFFSTKDRSVDYVGEARYNPSPAEYYVRKEYDKPVCITASVFKSVIPRFTSGKRTASMGPASYDTREQFNKNKNKQSHSISEAPFFSTGPRSTFCRVKYITPGPAEYETGLRKVEKGYYFKTTPRFEGEGDRKPGPTTYKIHPSWAISTYKSYFTHNLVLREKVLKEKIKTHPNDTYEAWLNGLDMEKKLRCFEGFYMHCPFPNAL